MGIEPVKILTVFVPYGHVIRCVGLMEAFCTCGRWDDVRVTDPANFMAWMNSLMIFDCQRFARFLSRAGYGKRNVLMPFKN